MPAISGINRHSPSAARPNEAMWMRRDGQTINRRERGSFSNVYSACKLTAGVETDPQWVVLSAAVDSGGQDTSTSSDVQILGMAMINGDEIRATMVRYVHGSEHPDLQVYRRGILDAQEQDLWLWRTKHYCNLGGFHGKRILEVGCGFGWDAVGLALVGNNEVVASDILPSMVDGMSMCLESMKAHGQPLAVTPLQGDICELDLPDASFDGIFSTEAIEHVHDLGDMFDTCWRLLRPGGTAVIVNDSNRFNPGARAHSWGSWQERDDSWEHVEWLKREVRPVEHADARPYGLMREEHLRQAAPDLSDDDVSKLRAATAGMIYSEIDNAVASFRHDGTLPARDEFGWSRNPETGEYSERLLDPFELTEMMRTRGFRVQLRHLFRKFPYRLLNNNGIRPLQERMFRSRPHFVLVARKPTR